VVSVWEPVSEVDLECEHYLCPAAGPGPLRDRVLNCEIDQLAGRVLSGKVALGLDGLS